MELDDPQSLRLGFALGGDLHEYAGAILHFSYSATSSQVCRTPSKQLRSSSVMSEYIFRSGADACLCISHQSPRPFWCNEDIRIMSESTPSNPCCTWLQCTRLFWYNEVPGKVTFTFDEVAFISPYLVR